MSESTNLLPDPDGLLTEPVQAQPVEAAVVAPAAVPVTVVLGKAGQPVEAPVQVLPDPAGPAAPILTPTSPKVWLATLVAFLTIVVGAVSAQLTPETFAGLGLFGPVAFAAVSAGLVWLAGYLKSDRLRSLGAQLAAVRTDIGPDGKQLPATVAGKHTAS